MLSCTQITLPCRRHSLLYTHPADLRLVFRDEASCDRCHIHHLRGCEGSGVSADDDERRSCHQRSTLGKVGVSRYYAMPEDIQRWVHEGEIRPDENDHGNEEIQDICGPITPILRNETDEGEEVGSQIPGGVAALVADLIEDEGPRARSLATSNQPHSVDEAIRCQYAEGDDCRRSAIPPPVTGWCCPERQHEPKRDVGYKEEANSDQVLRGSTQLGHLLHPLPVLAVRPSCSNILTKRLLVASDISGATCMEAVSRCSQATGRPEGRLSGFTRGHLFDWRGGKPMEDDSQGRLGV
jgi:hypothetical protein